MWTGNDYLVYQSNPDYRKYNMQKYLYRLSADFQQILNIYEIPNWITQMAFIDDKIYISTKNVYPKKMEIELLALVPMIMVFIIVQTILNGENLILKGMI